MTMQLDVPQFDDGRAIATYRDIIDQRNHSHSPELLSMFEEIADRLRNKWEEQHGEDTLHFAAFGELPLAG